MYLLIEPDDEEFRPIMKNARRKLEVLMPAPMPGKTPINCSGETCSRIGKHKTKYACMVDADEFLRIRLEGVPQKYHEDDITVKGVNSLSHCNLVHKFIPKPQSIQNTGCQGSSGQIMRKIGGNSGMAADESHKQERCDR